MPRTSPRLGRVAGRAADLGEAPAALAHVGVPLRAVADRRRPARGGRGRRPPARRTPPRSGRAPWPSRTGSSGETACEWPGTSRPSSLAQAARTNSCRLAICAFQPNRPTRPSARFRATAADVGGLFAAATSTSTSVGIASIRPAPKSAGVFRSERLRLSPAAACDGRCDRSRSRRSGVDLAPGSPGSARSTESSPGFARRVDPSSRCGVVEPPPPGAIRGIGPEPVEDGAARAAETGMDPVQALGPRPRPWGSP